MLTVTAKVRLQVDATQQALLDKTSEVYRNACNFVADYIYKTHALNIVVLQKQLYYTIRERFGLKAQMTQSVIRTVLSKYKAMGSNPQQWTKPNFRLPQCDLVWNRDYSLNEKFFSVNTLSGRIKLAYFKKGMESYLSQPHTFGTARLVSKHGMYFLHIPVSIETNECQKEDVCNVVGIDRGVNFIVTTYDSNGHTDFLRGGFIKQKRAKYKALRRSLQQRGTPSSRRRLRAIGQRENRWMQHVNHVVSKALVEQNPEHTLFVLEDLTGVRRATERVRRKDRYMLVSWPFYDLEQKLKYKASRKNDLVINVDPKYTSQRCPKCNHTEKGNRDKKKHIFCCKACGYRSNDDRIAAMNLYAMGNAALG